MNSGVAVINASPLIFLARGDHLNLLKHFTDQVFIPESVAQEIQARGLKDPAARAIENIPWLEVIQTAPVSAIQEWGLGPGETAVLEFACMPPRLPHVHLTGKGIHGKLK